MHDFTCLAAVKQVCFTIPLFSAVLSWWASANGVDLFSLAFVATFPDLLSALAQGIFLLLLLASGAAFSVVLLMILLSLRPLPSPVSPPPAEEPPVWPPVPHRSGPRFFPLPRIETAAHVRPAAAAPIRSGPSAFPHSRPLKSKYEPRLRAAAPIRSSRPPVVSYLCQPRTRPAAPPSAVLARLLLAGSVTAPGARARTTGPSPTVKAVVREGEVPPPSPLSEPPLHCPCRLPASRPPVLQRRSRGLRSALVWVHCKAALRRWRKEVVLFPPSVHIFHCLSLPVARRLRRMRSRSRRAVLVRSVRCHKVAVCLPH